MSQVAHKLREKSRTGDVLITENIDFNGLLLSDPVLNGLQNAGFVRPSPIQLKAIPLGRCGLDLIVQAKSGTGKTCVFSVIALESIATDTASTQVLVLAPTREIAVQIWEVINSIGSAVSGLECHTFIGGLPFQEDRMKLRKCHIAVGSPGRIKQLIESGALKTDSIRLFVLDEADKLLEESFQEQINWIYSTLPDNKQMLALSATYPEYLATLLTSYMRNPTYLRLNITDPTLLGIRQYHQTVPFHPMSQVVFELKCKALVTILSAVSFQQCLVFSNLQTRAQTLADSLVSQGWPTACIAGCLDQKDRSEAMAKLKTYKCRILISTDLTSRGIDADKVSLVVNLDVPKDHETYLHRIGRAGRFGAFGIAITLVSEGQEKLSLDSIEKRCNTQIHPLPDPLPHDLAKAEAPVLLDDVVSTEVINTEGHRETPAHILGTVAKTGNPVHCNGTSKSAAESVINYSSESLRSFNESKVKEHESDEKLNDLDKLDDLLAPDEKGHVNSGDGPTEHSVEATYGQVKAPNANDDGIEETDSGHFGDAHELQASVVKTSPLTQYDDNKSNTAVDIIQNVSAGFDLHHITKLGTEKEKEKHTKQTSEKRNKQLQDTPQVDSDDVESADEIFYVPQGHADPGYSRKMAAKFTLNSARVGLPQVFKQSIGYKPLANPYTYSAGQQSLRTFLEENHASNESGEKSKPVLSMPELTIENEETQKLRAIVNDLQDLFDKNLRVAVANIDHVEETEPETIESFSGKQKELIVSQSIATEGSPPLLDVDIESSVVKNSDATTEQGMDIKPAINVDVNPVFDGLKHNTPSECRESIKHTESQGIKQRKPQTVSRNVGKEKGRESTRRNRVEGFQGKFSIGHFLDVERQNARVEQDVDRQKATVEQDPGRQKATVEQDIERQRATVEQDVERQKATAEQDIEKQKATVEQDDTSCSTVAFCLSTTEKVEDDVGDVPAASAKAPGRTRREQERLSADAELPRYSQGMVQHKYQEEDTVKRNIHHTNMTVLENGHPHVESESDSDAVNSEHSGSDFSEDSESDSNSSIDREKSRGAKTCHRKSQTSVKGRQTRSNTLRTQNSSAQNHQNTEQNWTGYHENGRNIDHGTDRNYNSQTNHQFYPNQWQQHSRQPSSHYPNYWLPWYQYYGYNGYPFPQYSQCPPSNPYFGAQAMHDRTSFNQNLEATHRMQAEYIKAMCKMKDQ